MTAPEGSATVPRMVPLLMDCGAAGQAVRRQVSPIQIADRPKVNLIMCLHEERTAAK
jgi:hypothetical protein